jgi:dTDP-4-dehydrorhamnose 3,5-epimerase
MAISKDFLETSLDEVWLHIPTLHSDIRGTTLEIFNVNQCPIDHSFSPVTQILEATSSRGVIRGIHYSSPDNIQTKIVRCVAGEIRDIVIDFRPDSSSFGMYEVFDLNSENNATLYISHGFGHAYQVLSDNAKVVYTLNTRFSFSEEFSINPVDPELNLPWLDIPVIMSAKDANAPLFNVAMKQ